MDRKARRTWAVTAVTGIVMGAAVAGGLWLPTGAVVRAAPGEGTGPQGGSQNVSWYHQDPIEAAAFRIGFDVSPDAPCEIDIGMAGVNADSDGPVGVLLELHDGDLGSWLYVSQRYPVGAQAGGVHTSDALDEAAAVFSELQKEVFGYESHWGIRTWGAVEQPFTLVVVGRSLDPWPEQFPGDPPWPAHASVAVNADCQGGSSVTLEASREVVLFDGREMDNGTVVYSPGALRVGETVATLDGRVTRTFASSTVETFAGFAAGGDLTGEMTIDRPAGTTTWDLHDPSHLHLEDGAGTYDVHIDRISAPCGNLVSGNGGCNLWDNFVAGSWGLNPVDDPRDVLATPTLG